jgi:hypothetical protein
MRVVGDSTRLDLSHEGDGAALIQRDGCLLDLHQDMHQVVEGREGEGAVFPAQPGIGLLEPAGPPALEAVLLLEVDRAGQVQDVDGDDPLAQVDVVLPPQVDGGPEPGASCCRPQPD